MGMNKIYTTSVEEGTYTGKGDQIWHTVNRLISDTLTFENVLNTITCNT